MAIFKCKMCGGALEVNNESVAVCEYCGTHQTLPRLDDDRKANLYDRANHFRRNNEFDKAMGIYEQILNEDPADAETYWSLVLCRYGIEYVEDPTSRKRVPTVNRAQFTSVFDDDNYKSALQYADSIQKSIYEAEAKAINEIQKGILEISQKEEPFDVFICYKETDANGRRTPDSVLATELYHELIKEGFKVFFSRITLEDKLGTAYEPYIFAALNSAKVMVVLGTKQEYFNAVWVKNEWSRYLALIKQGQKKMLIPAYKDMDPYDLPEEFSHLQAQDMSKLGFMQDLIRGIKKIIDAQAPKTTVVKETVFASGNVNTNTAPLLKRVFMFLEDGDWNSANEYCEKVLDIEPENAEAYLGKLLAECKVKTRDDLANCESSFDKSANYQKVVRFGEKALVSELESYMESAKEKSENKRIEGIYNHAIAIMSKATTAGEFEQASEDFKSIAGYKDSAELAKECLEKAYDIVYASACEILDDNHTWLGKESDINAHEEAIQKFRSLNGWRDSEERILLCQKRIDDAKAKAEADRIEREQQAKRARIAAEKKKKRIAFFAMITIAVVIAVAVIISSVIIPAANYNKAGKLSENRDYVSAAIAYGKSGDYKDAKEKSFELWDEIAVRETISAGDDHTVSLKADGTVVAVGNNSFVECDVSDWTDIVAVSAGYYHTVGLKSDGTVVATDYCNYTSDWTDIVAVSAGGFHTVGLKSDGTVVAAGDNNNGECNVNSWTDIVAIAAGNGHTVGMKHDGTVIAVGNNDYGQCNVSSWTDIVAVSAGYKYTVGLKSDGTVVAVGYNDYGQCDVSGWTDIVAVSVGYYRTVGLKSDGTVVAVGHNSFGQCDVSGWTDIVAVSVGECHTVGLKSDGTVVAVGANGYGQCDVSDWTNIKLPE